MSPSLRSLYLSVRALLVMVAPVWAASMVMCGADNAWAGSPSSWAPMCDPSAATVVAPLVAPPVEAGEITICPEDVLLEDFEQAFVLQGSGPVGEPEPGIHFDAPVPRILPLLVVAAPRFAGSSELLLWPDVGAGPSVAFRRVPDRPPCA